MRSAAIALTGLLLTLAAAPAGAAVPNSVAALLGPSVGYLMAQSDLCQWNLTGKIQTAYQKGFKQIGMTHAQQTTVWEQAAAHQKRLANLPTEAKARMKTDTCTPASRARLEHDLAD